MANVTEDDISSIDQNVWLIIPAETVNSLSTTQLAGKYSIWKFCNYNKKIKIVKIFVLRLISNSSEQSC